MAEPGFTLLAGHASHVGRVRTINEDSYLFLTPPGTTSDISALMLVADGVGGANAGEVASGLLVQSFWDWFANDSYRELVHYNPAHDDYFVAVLKELLELTNERLHRLASSDVRLEAMGTTGTVGVLTRGRLFLGHVGDSRAYLLRQGTLRQLTTDHTWVNDEVAAGRMSRAQAHDHPKRHIVSRVLGNSLLLRVERDSFRVKENDFLIFASDGLTGLVDESEIRKMILNSKHPQQACNELVALANRRGGQDNITVLVARLRKAGQGSNLPSGVAVSSVHLGQPAARPAQQREVRRRRRRSLPPGAGRHLLLTALFSIIAGLLSASLAMLIAIVPQNEAGPWLGPFVAIGLFVTFSVWFGFFWGLGFSRSLPDS